MQNGVAMSFAVLYLPLVDDFHASRGEVATVQSAVLLLGGFGAPLVGWAFDRFGPRRLFQGGAALAALGFLLASRAPSLPLLVLTYGVIGGLGLACLGSQGNMTVAALWYPRARGRAIALVDLGTGFGAFCFIPLAQALVSRLGWRATLLAWAALLVLILVPLNALQSRPPAEPIAPAGARAASPRRPWTARGALGAPAFWFLALMRFAGACAFPLMNVHMVAYAIGHGIAPATAATALGAVSLVSLAGRMTTGWASDHIGRPLTLTLAYGSAAVAIGCLSLLAVTGAPWWLALYVAFYGMAQGSSGIIAAARAADVFAGPAFGTIWGLLGLAIGPGEALGAWLGGRIFDVTGSYLPAFGFAVAMLVTGVVAIWRVRA
ncbi:MAG TPA: MFS transporter [Methylomirabilota bacterium]|nr:MFS transporter [Methylomirabilota bacterium]